jgi:hypothetical protein
LSAVPASGEARAPEPAASSQPLDAGNLLWSILRERFLALFRKRSS